MSNVFMFITDQRGEGVCNGIQIDGGKAAKKFAEDRNYKIRTWDMGDKLHLHELSDNVRSEIRTELKAVYRRSHELRRTRNEH